MASKAKEKCHAHKTTKQIQHQTPPVDYKVLYEQETHRDWDLLSFKEQQKYVEEKVAEAEQRQRVRQKLSEQNMSNPAQASGSGMQAPATPVTIESLAQMLQGLSQAMGIMVTNINDLTTNINLANNIHPRMTIVVTKPKAWNGKGGSMEARHFLMAFFNYAQNEGNSLNDWDAAISDWQQNDDKWIVAILNLMEDEAQT